MTSLPFSLLVNSSNSFFSSNGSVSCSIFSPSIEVNAALNISLYAVLVNPCRALLFLATFLGLYILLNLLIKLYSFPYFCSSK